MLVEEKDCALRDTAALAIEAAQAVRAQLGPDCNEAAYTAAYERELELHEMPFRRDVWQAEKLGGMPLNCGHQIDMLVDNRLIVEVRAKRGLTRDDEIRLLTLLRLSGHSAGLLINFQERDFAQGVRRMTYRDETPAL